MKTNGKQGTFIYKRFQRDGSVKEITAILNDPKRKRTGKTERDKANTKRNKAPA